MQSITEPERQTPVVHDCDLCVVGGSATGVFAAIRAARLGLRVALIEQNVIFGGMATAAQVNEWHRLTDIEEREQIIGGLTAEVLERLKARDATVVGKREFCGTFTTFNSAEMALELDRLVLEHEIRCFLKCSCVAAQRDGGRITAVIIEDKTGRRAITARQFIDCSGDGDLVRRAGFSARREDVMQPVMYNMIVGGVQALEKQIGSGLWPQIVDAAVELGYPKVNAKPWINPYPSNADINNIYGPRQQGVDASDADQLTQAILTGRWHLDSLLMAIRDRYGNAVSPLSFAHSLGIRETWHADCLKRVIGSEMLNGEPCTDSIGRGTYPVDIHSPDGTRLRRLDGYEELIDLNGDRQLKRWREAGTASPSFYHIPFRALVPVGGENLLVAGRLIDADREAYGGLRVMVNCNQTGEAAGVASALAIRHGCDVASVDIQSLRNALIYGDSLLG